MDEQRLQEIEAWVAQELAYLCEIGCTQSSSPFARTKAVEALIAEVSQIRAERDADRKTLTCLKRDFNTVFEDNAEKQDEIASLTAALAEARRVLRDVEWVSQYGKITGPSIPEWAWCPCCGKTRQDDHTPADCALAAVLAQEEPS